jgi:DNA-directed RNA polymerase specialized sigma24 family protein
MHDFSDQNHDRFLRLFAEHEPALRTFVRSLLHSRSDASEVLQEIRQKAGEETVFNR